MKRVIVLIGMFSLLLTGCSSNIEESSTSVEKNITSSKKVDFIEFEATLLDKNSFELIKSQHQNIALPAYTDTDIVVSLSLSNHRENLETLDYVSSTLDRSSAKKWTILESNMGGHHVSGILRFSGSQNSATPKELILSDTPVGEVKLLFNLQKDE